MDNLDISTEIENTAETIAAIVAALDITTDQSNDTLPLESVRWLILDIGNKAEKIAYLIRQFQIQKREREEITQ